MKTIMIASLTLSIFTSTVAISETVGGPTGVASDVSASGTLVAENERFRVEANISCPYWGYHRTDSDMRYGADCVSTNGSIKVFRVEARTNCPSGFMRNSADMRYGADCYLKSAFNKIPVDRGTECPGGFKRTDVLRWSADCIRY